MVPISVYSNLLKIVNQGEFPYVSSSISSSVIIVFESYGIEIYRIEYDSFFSNKFSKIRTIWVN